MSFALKVLEGKNAERTIALTTRFLIGREQDCHLRPTSDLVSRHHCALTIEGDHCWVTDLGSKNGTLVNEVPVQGRVRLRHGDKLRIGKLLFSLVRMEHKEDEVCTLTEVSRSPDQLLAEICRQLPQRHLHVPLPGAELEGRLAMREPETLAQLGRGFSGVVVVDVAASLNTGRCDYELLLRTIRDSMFREYGISPPPHFHPQQVVQLLKEKPRSLFVFLRVEHLTGPLLQRLREFTQSRHRVLFCGHNPLIDPGAERQDVDDWVETWSIASPSQVREISSDESRRDSSVMPLPVPDEDGAPRSSPPAKRLPTSPPEPSRDAAAEILRKFFNR